MVARIVSDRLPVDIECPLIYTIEPKMNEGCPSSSMVEQPTCNR